MTCSLRQTLRSEDRLPEAGQMSPRDISGAGAHSGGNTQLWRDYFDPWKWIYFEELSKDPKSTVTTTGFPNYISVHPCRPHFITTRSSFCFALFVFFSVDCESSHSCLSGQFGDSLR